MIGNMYVTKEEIDSIFEIERQSVVELREMMLLLEKRVTLAASAPEENEQLKQRRVGFCNPISPKFDFEKRRVSIIG